jgi:hypothetical protein
MWEGRCREYWRNLDIILGSWHLLFKHIERERERVFTYTGGVMLVGGARGH